MLESRTVTRFALNLVIAGAFVAAACGCTTTKLSATQPGQITVVATTTQMQDMVRNVGGGRVHLVGILKPNVDPHDFEPTPGTAVALSGAKLVVESGIGVDSWADQLVESAGSGTPVFVASDGLPVRPGDSAEPAGDPHWWHDPTLFERAAVALAHRLGEIDPGGRAVYQRNADRYVARIQSMDRANLELIATVPRQQRKLVTNHDAFGYFAAHYGITIIGSVIPSLSTAAQPSAQSVADLIKRIRAAHVRAIFTESSLNPSLEERIASEAAVRVYANLYGDTLGPPGSPGSTYVSMERWNMRAMVAGFLGKKPPTA
jgi:zinc/manganese transport system substrate-binding protein